MWAELIYNHYLNILKILQELERLSIKPIE